MIKNFGKFIRHELILFFFFFCFLGVGGLLLAHMLLEKKIERNVCIFEKENRLGGKIYDHFFSEAPDISVGQFSVQRQKQKNCMCFSDGKMSFWTAPIFCTLEKRQGRLE